MGPHTSLLRVLLGRSNASSPRPFSEWDFPSTSPPRMPNPNRIVPDIMVIGPEEEGSVAYCAFRAEDECPSPPTPDFRALAEALNFLEQNSSFASDAPVFRRVSSEELERTVVMPRKGPANRSSSGTTSRPVSVADYQDEEDEEENANRRAATRNVHFAHRVSFSPEVQDIPLSEERKSFKSRAASALRSLRTSSSVKTKNRASSVRDSAVADFSPEVEAPDSPRPPSVAYFPAHRLGTLRSNRIRRKKTLTQLFGLSQLHNQPVFDPVSPPPPVPPKEAPQTPVFERPLTPLPLSPPVTPPRPSGSPNSTSSPRSGSSTPTSRPKGLRARPFSFREMNKREGANSSKASIDSSPPITPTDDAILPPSPPPKDSPLFEPPKISPPPPVGLPMKLDSLHFDALAFDPFEF